MRAFSFHALRFRDSFEGEKSELPARQLLRDRKGTLYRRFKRALRICNASWCELGSKAAFPQTQQANANHGFAFYGFGRSRTLVNVRIHFCRVGCKAEGKYRSGRLAANAELSMIRIFALRLGLLAMVVGWLAIPLGTQGAVVINEIMYHPAPAIPEEPAKEWVEMFNTGLQSVDLANWRLQGVSFVFSNTVIPAGGYLVVAANAEVFKTNYPGVINMVGGWTGKLRNSGETVQLLDNFGQTMDSVTYTSEGDWALRRVREPYPGQPAWWSGWQWTTPADGAGHSLERIQVGMPTKYGQNWGASTIAGGTPGRGNSIATNHIAPLIAEVQHFPVIPRATNSVTVSARLLPESGGTAAAQLFYRVDGAAVFSSTAMLDDGLHGDGSAFDSIFGATLPPQPDRTIVEFYVRATDQTGRARTWPGPSDDLGAQAANALYQVDESTYSDRQPIYRFIFKASEWEAWVNLMDNVANGRYSDATMNATVVRSDGTGTDLRYLAGVRNRGAGTRAAHPHNLHLAIPRDNPLNGSTRLDFNTRTVHAQVAGNAFFNAARLAGVFGTPAQVRLNGQNLANATPTGEVDSFQFGSYYCFEPYDTDWAARHMPQDAAGNLYKGTWYLDNMQLQSGATLAYLGTNPAAYKQQYAPHGATGNTGPYSKQSNTSEDDWSDLIHLCYALSTNTPDLNYLAVAESVANLDQWLAHIALHSLLINMETTLATGTGDDFAMYRGGADPRFILLPHDFDTVLGQGDYGPDFTRSVFKAADLPVLNRLLKHPKVAPRYFAALQKLVEGLMHPTNSAPFLDQTLKGWLPSAYIQNMKDVAAKRWTNVVNQIPLSLSVETTLPVTNGYSRTTSPSVSLAGKANAIRTSEVLVNGQPAAYIAWQAAWSIAAVPLTPGLNRVLVQSLDTNGVEFARANLDIWYDDATLMTVTGALTESTVWTAANGPYLVNSSLNIPAGLTLTIEPGTTVYLGSGANLVVANGGRLLAEGNQFQPIRFSTLPGSAGSWGNLTIDGVVGSPETRIRHAFFEGNGGTCIEVAGGSIYLDHVSFGTRTHQYLALDGASFLIDSCVFPSATTAFELVHGTIGIRADGRGIIQNSLFGTTIGYSDVVDFTGGNRDLNQPILQFINNVFLGSSDDALDLDGTDAWVEGNIFLHVHRNGAPDSSSAISGGNNNFGGTAGVRTSEITVIRNLFFDCDHVATAKQGNFFTLLNNTIIHTTKAGGEDTASGVLNVRDVDPTPTTFGAGFYVEGNLMVDAEQLTRNYDPAQTSVVFSNNFLPFAWNGPGGGNSVADPHLNYLPSLSQTFFTTWEEAQVMWAWFRLQPGSPARAALPDGSDAGAVVPPGVRLGGGPIGLTASRSAQLSVGPLRTGAGIPTLGFPFGSGYTHYRWRLDDGPWSAETSSTNPILLSNLTDGQHQVTAVGKRDSGSWQDASEFAPADLASTSGVWTVNGSLRRLIINEVLAENYNAVRLGDSSPDLVEIFNAGANAIDLSGMSLTDDPTNPDRFVFPPGSSLGAGQYRVLIADSPAGSNLLGFAISKSGGGLWLFDSAAQGKVLLDSVQFGVQLQDRSIGRDPQGRWTLGIPTLGGANRRAATGDVRRLRINEWLAASGIRDDFIEIFNPDSLPTDLGGCSISDAPAGWPQRNLFPPLTFIPANGFGLFVADGKTGQGADHLSFNLAAEWGTLALIGPDGALIDRISYGPQTSEVSMGRSPNGQGSFVTFNTPTPGAGNPSILGACTISNSILSLMTYTQAWRYNETSNLDAVSWMAVNYSDNAWLGGNGLLGFENNSAIRPLINTLLTEPFTPPAGLSSGHAYYFRTHFSVTNDLSTVTITARCRLDDGGVFYLNGEELHRIRIPDGLVTNATRANGFPPSPDGSDDAVIDESFTFPGSALLVGSNVFAVSVHQQSSKSSDIVFGLALEVAQLVTNCAPSAVIINEVLADNGSLTNGDGSITDWVELYNPGAASVSLDGYSLTDDVGLPQRWLFPPGAQLPPLGFLVVRCDPASVPSAVNGPVLNTGFGLKANGGDVFLFDATASLSDSVGFGGQAANFSITRHPDGSGPWQLGLPTPGEGAIPAALGDPRHVRINEWAAAVANGPDWFELYNPDLQPVALQGAFLTDKLSNRTKHSIAPLTFIGVSTNAYRKFIADNDAAQGPTHVGFSLDAGGEAIGLFPPGTDPAIDTVSFGAQTNGFSQGRLPDGGDSIRFFTHPSPGAANWFPLTNVFINEILTHTDLPLEDAVELWNISDASVNISGWYLSDSSRNLRKYRIPEGTILPPYGFAVFYEYQFNPNPLSASAFSFSSANGDQAWLTAATSDGSPTGYRDLVDFGPQFNGVSFGRVVTSIGPALTALSSPSFGSVVTAQSPTNQIALFRLGKGGTNAVPRVGPVVFSEIMYRPPPVGTNDNLFDEFIELRNLSGAPVPLYDILHRTNGWRLRGAVSFNFSTSHVIPAGGFLVLVGFDPSTNLTALNAFRARYGTQVGLVGPWTGKLSNNGEILDLFAPDAPQTTGPDIGLVPYVSVERVSYSSAFPWPAGADGTGLSLQKSDATSFSDDPAHWIADAPTCGGDGVVDSDGDGIPDSWETLYSLTNSVNDAGLDLDHDGLSNLQEYLANTNPRDPNSRLQFEAITPAANRVEIRFQARPQRSYSVLFAHPTAPLVWVKLADIPSESAARNLVLTDILEAAPSGRLYRLVTPSLP
jgi:hypothetical protein